VIVWLLSQSLVDVGPVHAGDRRDGP
jgi:hypothetical protein